MVKAANLFGIFTSYFDEAGASEHGFIAVCGYIASVESRECFAGEWNDLLRWHNVPHLHMKDVAHFKHPYERWKTDPNGRAAFLGDASSLINRTVGCAFVCIVRFADFERVNREFYLAENFYSPYALAGRWCVARSNVQVESIGRSLKEIRYVFEDGHADAGKLVQLMQRSNLQIPSFEPGRDTETRAGVVQPQAADYLAYELRKAVADHRDPFSKPDAFRMSFQALLGLPADQGNFADAQLTDLCESSGIPRRV